MHAEAARVRPRIAPSRARGSGRRYRATQSARSASDGVARWPGWARSQLEPGGAGADAAGHVQGVARPAASPRQDLARFDTADNRHVHDERPGRPRHVPSREGDPAGPRHPDEPLDQSVQLFEVEVPRQHQREQRVPRRTAHRGDVAHVDGQRLVPDVGGGGIAAVEMDALDERIGREDLERAAFRGRDGGIVADADDERGRRLGHPLPDARDDGAFAGLGDAEAGGRRRITGRIQRPGSP